MHSFWLGQAWLIGRALAKRNGVPHTTTLMGQDVLRSVNGLYLWLLNAKTAANTIALSQFHAHQLELETGFAPGAVIPWGIPHYEFDHAPWETRTVHLLGVGSLLPVKNWDLWLQVVAQIARKQPSLRVVLIGDGPEKKRLTALIEAYGISEQVRLTGPLKRSEVLMLMRNSKILLHTSRFESYGFVLAEAVAAGCRVVSTPVGIAEETGWVGKTADELANLVELALQQEKTSVHTLFLLENTITAYLKHWMISA